MGLFDIFKKKKKEEVIDPEVLRERFVSARRQNLNFCQRNYVETAEIFSVFSNSDKLELVKGDEILKEYIRLADLELGIETAVVASARPLDETQMERIRQALEIKTGHRIQLVNTIDKSLIAGIKVTAGNTVTDVTVARQIEGMKEALLKGGNA